MRHWLHQIQNLILQQFDARKWYIYDCIYDVYMQWCIYNCIYARMQRIAKVTQCKSVGLMQSIANVFDTV
jgi:hypothetical protein